MLKYNPDLVYQVVRAKILNKKRPIASTKDRSEVRGGGKKPWPQKGTGRARAGSLRSPLFRGGGVTFGPRSQRNYKKRLPYQMKRVALGMVIEKKRVEGEVKEVDEISFKDYKTKIFAKWLKKLLGDASALVVVHKDLSLLKQAGQNISQVKVRDPDNIDVFDLLKYKYLVGTPEALKRLKERADLKTKTQKAKP